MESPHRSPTGRGICAGGLPSISSPTPSTKTCRWGPRCWAIVTRSLRDLPDAGSCKKVHPSVEFLTCSHSLSSCRMLILPSCSAFHNAGRLRRADGPGLRLFVQGQRRLTGLKPGYVRRFPSANRVACSDSASPEVFGRCCAGILRAHFIPD